MVERRQAVATPEMQFAEAPVDVHIPTPDGEMPAYFRTPHGVGPWPGVVGIHGAAGSTRDLRAQADWLASEGFLALAPDLFHQDGRWRCLFRSIRDPVHPTPDRWRSDRIARARPASSAFAMVGGWPCCLRPTTTFPWPA